MGFLRTYRGKIIFIAVIGIQIPILALMYYLWLSTVFFAQNIIFDANIGMMSILSTILFADFTGTAITIFALYYSLAPVETACNNGDRYFQHTSFKHLPASLQNSFGMTMPLEKAAKRLTWHRAISNDDCTSEELQDIIQNLVYFDTLTGLPNRVLFQTCIEQAISETSESQQFALIALDLNSLKSINSTLGHQVGDLLLIKVAQRLSSHITKDDVLARFGGDEFVILRKNIINSDSPISLSNQLLSSLAKPFSLYGKKIHCDAKIGITIYPFDGITVEQLFQNADTAIYQASNQKLNTYQFYSSVAREKLERSLAIKENLRYALARNELSLHYQPRIKIFTGCIVGVEALLRWYNPQLGWVSPNEFIPIAEEIELIIPIGEWVLQNACLQNKQWQDDQLSPLKVSVNLSACQFKQKNLVETIDRILDRANLDAAYLELEITESILVDDIERAIETLRELKHRGISIALDDFGTGYSSLSYLQKLPIDTLKIDRSFVKNVDSNMDDAAISNAIVALGQSLKLNITAEGVENVEQLNYLQAQGCDEVQGYYFSKPLPSSLLQDFLSKHA